MEEREQIKSLMTQCCLSTKVTAKVLFPDRFDRPFAQLTDEIFYILDNDEIQKAVVVAPRGWGKTSICNMAFPAKKILFQEKKFVVPISCSATQAVMQSENLKRELMSNHIINKIFGSVKSSDANNPFAKEMWITSSGTAVLPRGTGQQVRGILHGNSRPDLIIGDDLEDPEDVKNPDLRKKMKDWFFADVLNSVNRGRNDWKIIVIGTLLHEDSLLQNLMDDPTWYHAHLALCNDDLHSNWPEYMSDEEIEKMARSYEVQGLLDVFAREFQGKMQSEKERKFKQEYFKSYSEDSEEFLKKRGKLLNLVIVDPAKTTTETADETAIVGVGVDIDAPAVYVRDVVSGRFHPDEQIEEAFGMARRLGARVIGLEVTSLNEFITWPWRNAMIQKRMFFDLVELKARGGKDAKSKEARVAGLIAPYRLGLFYHNKSATLSLEMQLLSYPRSKKWDVMDALAYLIEMLEAGNLYFTGSDDQDAGATEDEFNELRDDYEPALAGWRNA